MIRVLLLGIFLSINGFFVNAKGKILDQVISIEIKNTPINIVLKRIEEIGKIKFSYNPDLINVQKKVSVTLKQKTIHYGLNLIFENKVRLKEVGSHILILKKEKPVEAPAVKKQHHIIGGKVTDKASGVVIPNVSVYDVDSKFSTLTNESGEFNLKIPTTYNSISLYYAKTQYKTDVKLIAINEVSQPNGSLSLIKKEEDIDKLPSAPVPKKIWIELEDKTISGELFSVDVSTHYENLEHINENRWAQFSVIPRLSLKAGKNYQGILYNHFSLNLLSGYSKGLKGIEIGGIANILKDEALGAQFSGIVNLVGGNFKGIQTAGISNVVKRDFWGLQVGGVSNTSRMNFYGVQTVGIINSVNKNFVGIQASFAGNTINGKCIGMQFAGMINSTQKKMIGLQIAGFSSGAKDGFYGIQLSGLINHTSGVSYGLQASGIQNVSLDKLIGAQMTGFMNSAIKGTNLFQLAGFLNIANKNNGLQFAGLVNYTNHNNGLQLGLVNISKENKGLSIGLVNFVWNGYHKIETFTNETFLTNIRIKSGVKRLYNIYSIGRQFNGNKSLTSLGFGFGAIYNISETFAISTDIEGIVAFNREMEFTQLAKFSPSLDFKISEHIAIFAGPTGNINYGNSEFNKIQIDQYSIYNETTSNTNLNVWIGGQFGLRF